MSHQLMLINMAMVLALQLAGLESLRHLKFLTPIFPQTQLALTRDGVFVWINVFAFVLYASGRPAAFLLEKRRYIYKPNLFCWMMVSINNKCIMSITTINAINYNNIFYFLIFYLLLSKLISNDNK